jgi:hypothetical protein
MHDRNPPDLDARRIDGAQADEVRQVELVLGRLRQTVPLDERSAAVRSATGRPSASRSSATPAWRQDSVQRRPCSSSNGP